MSALSRKSVQAKAAPKSRKAPVRLAGDQDQAAPSPALQQRQTLPEQWAESSRHAAEPAKWSRGRTLAFIGLTCGGFWTCVIFGVASLAR